MRKSIVNKQMQIQQKEISARRRRKSIVSKQIQMQQKKYPQDGGRYPESGARLDPAHDLHDAWRGGRAQGAG